MGILWYDLFFSLVKRTPGNASLYLLLSGLSSGSPFLSLHFRSSAFVAKISRSNCQNNFCRRRFSMSSIQVCFLLSWRAWSKRVRTHEENLPRKLRKLVGYFACWVRNTAGWFCFSRVAIGTWLHVSFSICSCEMQTASNSLNKHISDNWRSNHKPGYFSFLKVLTVLNDVLITLVLILFSLTYAKMLWIDSMPGWALDVIYGVLRFRSYWASSWLTSDVLKLNSK